MVIDGQQLRTVSGRVLERARGEQLTLLAAGVAFYAFLSFVPLALLVVSLAATVGGEALVERVTAATGDVFTPAAQDLLAETLVDTSGRWTATAVGILGVLWGASRVLRGLDRAFSAVYGTVAGKSFVDTLWDALLVAVAVTVGLGLVAVVEVLVLVVPVAIVETTVAGYVLVLAGLFVAFLPMYAIFPGTDVRIREAIPGTIIATVGWFLLSRLFAVYASVAGDFALYGALGGVFLVLVWFYLGAAIVITGALVNAVLAESDADRQLQHHGDRQVSTEPMTDEPDAREPSRDADGRRPTDTTPSTTAPSTTAAAHDGARSSGHPGSVERDQDRTRDRLDDPAALREEIERLRDRLETFEDDVDSRTVDRERLESDLKRYVRRRVRRNHARGWGPYLVLAYGTAMSVAAFYFLDGGWAILAMFVVWTSTLGVYLLMMVFGAGLSALGLPGRLRDRVGEWRS